MRKLWLATIAVTAGCAATAGMPLPDATVQVTPTRDATWPAARGETALVVRAVAIDALGAEGDIAGARCTADSPFYTAEFEAPARVLVPDFGSASPTVTVACRAGGAEGRVLARPELRGTGGFYGWPAVGVSVGTGGFDGVGVGVGWYGGGTGWSGGSAAIHYPAVRVAMS